MIGIIGGTGLYAMPELKAPRAQDLTTPFGAPSAPLIRERCAGAKSLSSRATG